MSDEKSGLDHPTQLKQLNLNEMSKLSWIDLPRKDFNSLIKDVVDNLENKDYKTTVDTNPYNFKKAKKFLLEIGTKKNSKDDAPNLYSSLIKPDVDILEKATGKMGKGERNNILTIFKNIESSLFEGVYYHCSDKPSESGETITERTKEDKEIAKKEKKMSFELFKKYFGYLSPSNMYKALNEAKNLEENKTKVNIIENKLTNLIKLLKNSPTNDAKKIKNKNNMLEIVELILYFNQLNQSGKGLKTLTAYQILRRSPISLAQLNTGNNSEKLKNKIWQLLYSLYRSKKLTKNVYKSLIDII